MKALLWTILILGVFEVASMLAYWTVGKFPERTVAGSVISALIWAGFAVWAAYLLRSAS